MKFLVPNYSCLQNSWLGGYCPQIPVLSVLNWICWTPLPPKKNSWVRHCSTCFGWQFRPSSGALWLYIQLFGTMYQLCCLLLTGDTDWMDIVSSVESPVIKLIYDGQNVSVLSVCSWCVCTEWTGGCFARIKPKFHGNTSLFTKNHQQKVKN